MDSTASSSTSSVPSSSSSTGPSSSSSPSTSPPPSSTTSRSTTPSSSASNPPPSSSDTISASKSTSTSSNTSTTSTTAAATTPQTPSTTSSSTKVNVTTSNGVVVTVTSFTAIIPTDTPTNSTITSSHAGNKSFFDNKGAVAGVFTVVGLIVLALIAALITNIIRRRRAKRFDREIAEAAQEAAAAPAPIFLDDEDDYGRGGYGGAYSGGQYSDVSSHGTYGQPAMSTNHGSSGEAYGMRELGPAPGELYNPYSAAAMAAVGTGAAGAAGVGVARARSTRDPGAFANGLMEGSTPYPAFAGPAGYAQPQDQQQRQPHYTKASMGYNRGPGSPENDLLEIAGMGAGVAGMQRGMSLSHYQQNQPQPYPDLMRSQSQARSAETGRSNSHSSKGSPTSPQESYTAPYGSGGYPSPPQQHGYSVDEGEDAAYGGYTRGAQPQSHVQGDTGRVAPWDEDEEEEQEEEQGRRVLKVANE